jgi:hypothetical protein
MIPLHGSETNMDSDDGNAGYQDCEIERKEGVACSDGLGENYKHRGQHRRWSPV